MHKIVATHKSYDRRPKSQKHEWKVYVRGDGDIRKGELCEKGEEEEEDRKNTESEDQKDRRHGERRGSGDIVTFVEDKREFPGCWKRNRTGVKILKDTTKWHVQKQKTQK